MSRPDIRIDPTSFFRFLLHNGYTIGKLCAIVDRAFKDWFRREKAGAWKLDEYVRHHLAKRLLDDIHAAASNPSADIRATLNRLTEFLAAVQMPFEGLVRFDHSRAPFTHWKPGSVVAVCVAKRAGRNAEGEAAEAQWLRFVHGGRDVQAINDLNETLQKKLHLDFVLRIIPVDPVLPVTFPNSAAPAKRRREIGNARRAARRLFGRLLGDPRIGAIVSLGSVPHNPISDLMARRIAEGFDLFPVAFRWTGSERREIDFLAEGKKLCAAWLTEKARNAETGEAGIWFQARGIQPEFFPRVTDKKIKAGQKRDLPDCGVLAIDIRRNRSALPIGDRSEPLLILAAGHGGSGTRACVKALRETSIIESRMGTAEADTNFHSAPERFVQVVLAQRERTGRGNTVDDVSLKDQQKESGYRFTFSE